MIVYRERFDRQFFVIAPCCISAACRTATTQGSHDSSRGVILPRRRMTRLDRPLLTPHRKHKMRRYPGGHNAHPFPSTPAIRDSSGGSLGQRVLRDHDRHRSQATRLLPLSDSPVFLLQPTFPPNSQRRTATARKSRVCEASCETPRRGVRPGPW